MRLDHYAACDALELARLVREGEIAPDEPIVAARAALAALNPQLNAFVDTAFERPPQDAGGAFHGVPLALKDCVGFAAGASYSFGSRLASGTVAADDSEVIARYRRAGFHLFGLTNVPEFSSLVTTESVRHGPAHNPWRAGFSPGGSSGGAAAAVAARIVPVAYANDGAGSIRVPAACCGVVGMKPSRGRIPTGPHKNDFWHGLMAHNVITRTVRDTAALIDATHGLDAGAPYGAPALERPLVAELDAPVAGLRIACVVDSPYGEPVDPRCAGAARALLPRLEELGCVIVDARPACDGRRMLEDVATLIGVSIATDLPAFAAAAGRPAGVDTVERNNLRWAERGARTPATELQALLYRFGALGRTLGRFFATEADVLLTPTTALPPPPHGWLDADGEDFEQFLHRFWTFSPYASLANVTGVPSISIPAGMTSQGLPLGAMLTAPFGAEARLIRIASALEAALRWPQRAPALATASLCA